MQKCIMLIILFCMVLFNGCAQQEPPTVQDIPAQEEPAQEASQPAQETFQPAQETSQPAEETFQPAEEASQSVEETSQPAEELAEEKVYELQAYGTTEERKQEYNREASEETAYYYEMECFYFDDSFPASINDTLRTIYDAYETQYQQDADVYQTDESYPDVPYSSLHLLQLTYVGEDYVSILYNDIAYMGGAHPYSSLNGITIDCHTGREAAASEIMEKSDEVILKEVCETMGMDQTAEWGEVDFYLTDENIVFFYHQPMFWEDVIWERVN